VLHFYWLVKADITRPVRYGVVLAVLLGFRLAFKLAPAMKKLLSKRSIRILPSSPASRGRKEVGAGTERSD